MTTKILFSSNDNKPSNVIDLESGRRYNASYTYDMMKTVANVNVSILPFGSNPDQNITVEVDNITQPDSADDNNN